MKKLYFITYKFCYKGFYSQDLKDGDVEEKIETFTGDERNSWIKRYQKVKKQTEIGFNHKSLESGFISNISDFSLSNDDMESVINGI